VNVAKLLSQVQISRCISSARLNKTPTGIRSDRRLFEQEQDSRLQQDMDAKAIVNVHVDASSSSNERNVDDNFQKHMWFVGLVI